MIGKTLSHYKILDELSRGGMGVVYRAVDTKLNREVALKVLPDNLIADPERKRRFTQEAQAAASLEHPNIAVIYEIDEADGVTFMVMELIRGEKLSVVIEKERPSLKRSLDLCLEVAEGLAEAHDKGIVHRDIKPDNVMLAPNGHAKIIDFGLAKLVEPLGGDEETEAHTAVRRETDPGVVMGTASYMSPEQARGAKVDHRSDIFSFGIVLYELMSGKPPFQGNSGIEILNAILKETPAPLPPLGGDVMPEAAFELQHIVDKCLAKDVRDRYQGMKDLVVDLRSAGRRLESTTISGVRSSGAVPVASETPKRNTWLMGGGVAVGLLAVVAILIFMTPTAQEPTPRQAAKPSLAVLYFQNNTGDSSLDWLRTALADMLVTDLSQSPEVDVLGTDRLYEILEEMNRLDQRITSFAVVKEVAERAGVNNVLLGDFVKAGDTIRISVRLQEAETGKILTTEKVEGVGEESIFPMVDDLTQRIKSKFEIPTTADDELDRPLKDVTTDSVEAYRYFAEGYRMQTQGNDRNAIPLLEKAVEVDPEFAIALASLSDAYWNLGQRTKAEDASRRALENLDRLTTRERYFIEGNYYTLREENYLRGIEAFKKGLELWPNHTDSRNNLANVYAYLELYEDAIELDEELARRGERFPGVYNRLARSYSALGEREKADRVLQNYSQRSPGGTAHLWLGIHHSEWGAWDKALEAYAKAQEIIPDWPRPRWGQFEVASLTGQWGEARGIAREFAESSVPRRQYSGATGLARLHLYRGDSSEALRWAKKAASVYSPPEPDQTQGATLTAWILLQRNEPDAALAPAREAQEQGKGNWGEWVGLYLESLSLSRLRRMDDAAKVAEKLRERIAPIPGPKEVRRHQLLLGELALADGDTAGAIEQLARAESTLAPRRYMASQHVPVWFALGSAYLEAGKEAQAAERFRRVTESTTEYIDFPIPYVRSFYFLGKIHESRGDADKARQYYQRFVDFWKDGDLDRERVEEALSKL